MRQRMYGLVDASYGIQSIHYSKEEAIKKSNEEKFDPEYPLFLYIETYIMSAEQIKKSYLVK